MSRRQVYVDSKSNPYGASQMDHASAQKTRSGVTMDNFPGRLSLEEQNSYKGQWQWDRDRDRDESKELNHISSYSFNQGVAGQGGIDSTSYYQGPNSLNIPAYKDTSTQAAEQDMEIGYGDSPSPSPSTFEGLERKFHDEIMQLVKEQSDAENAENTRHREMMIEINTKYQEKLQAMRAQQASRRQAFLHKESQTRLHHYHQARMSHYSNTDSQDASGYGSEAVAATSTAYDGYTPGRFEPYREQPQSIGGRTQATEARVPYPKGRIYNGSTPYY